MQHGRLSVMRLMLWVLRKEGKKNKGKKSLLIKVDQQRRTLCLQLSNQGAALLRWADNWNWGRWHPRTTDQCSPASLVCPLRGQWLVSSSSFNSRVSCCCPAVCCSVVQHAVDSCDLGLLVWAVEKRSAPPVRSEQRHGSFLSTPNVRSTMSLIQVESWCQEDVMGSGDSTSWWMSHALTPGYCATMFVVVPFKSHTTCTLPVSVKCAPCMRGEEAISSRRFGVFCVFWQTGPCFVFAEGKKAKWITSVIFAHRRSRRCAWSVDQLQHVFVHIFTHTNTFRK